MQTRLQLYQKVTPLAHLGIWERNQKSGEIYWNAVMRGIYEVDSAFEPTAEKILPFYVDQSAIVSFMQEAMTSGIPKIGEFEIQTVDGVHKWIKIRVQAEFVDQECRTVFRTIEDVSSQVRLISKLAAQEEQFHQAFEFAPIGMALVSRKGDWIRVNRNLCSIFGYTNDELLKKNIQELTFDADLHIDRDLTRQLIADEIQTYQIEKRYLHKNGSIVWAFLHVTLVRDPAGEPLYFVAQIKNITDRKEMDIERVKTLEIISAK